MPNLLMRYKTVTATLEHVVSASHRAKGSVQLLAVSKTFPAEDIATLYDAGQRLFGENYVQEWADKVAQLSHLQIEWHFIGALQSNKTRTVAEHAHWVHTVDRVKIAERLHAQRPEEMPVLNVCLEVNVSGEVQKHGMAVDDVLDVANAISELPNLRLRGLMCIPTATDDVNILKQQFKKMQTLLLMLQQSGHDVDTLSMGMSQDMALAIENGSTMVRVGSAIFGSRQYA